MCVVKIWDSAGQEKYKNVPSSYYKQAEGVIIAFDLTKLSSFFEVKKWLKSIKDQTGRAGAEPIPVVLVGNKLDLANAGERAVEKNTAQEYADQNGMTYHETSAKENIGVDELMKDIQDKTYKHVKAIHEKLKQNQPDDSPEEPNDVESQPNPNPIERKKRQ